MDQENPGSTRTHACLSPHVPRILVALSFFLLTGPALSVPITTPPGLNPGDPYRLAFVTSTSRDATSSNITEYNQFVDDQAETVAALAALNQDWKAIASTASVDALTNTSTDPSPAGNTGVPIFLLDGTKIADHYDELWSAALDAPVNVTESGAPSGDQVVWTGSEPTGTAATFSMGTPSTVRAGRTLFTDSRWIGQFDLAPTELHPLYGISGVLSAAESAVPEPGTAFSLVAGLWLLLLRYRSARAPGSAAP